MAKAVVALLVVIAIAGIVLALRGRSAPPDAPAAADATQAGAPAMTASAASAAAAAESEAGPEQIVFLPGSDKISERSTAKLVSFAASAKKQGKGVTLTGVIEARPDRNEQLQLAQNRVYAARQVLEGKGVPLGSMAVKIEERAFGLVPAREANRVDLALR